MSKNSNFKHTYFIDRALGKSVDLALQKLGVKIEFHLVPLREKNKHHDNLKNSFSRR